MSSSSTRNEANEIDLVELFIALWRHKLLIALVTLSVFLICATYAFTAKPVFESSVTLAPASLRDLGAVARKFNEQAAGDDITSLKQARLLLEEAFQIFAEQLNSPGMKSEFRLSSDLKGTGGGADVVLDTPVSKLSLQKAITVTARASNPELARSTVEAYVAFVGLRTLQEVNDFYKVSAPEEGDALSGIYKVQSKAQLNSNPVKPRKALILALGIVLGMMLGVFVSLVLIVIANKRSDVLAPVVAR